MFLKPGVAAVAALGGTCLSGALQGSGKKEKGLGKTITTFGMERPGHIWVR